MPNESESDSAAIELANDDIPAAMRQRVLPRMCRLSP